MVRKYLQHIFIWFCLKFIDLQLLKKNLNMKWKQLKRRRNFLKKEALSGCPSKHHKKKLNKVKKKKQNKKKHGCQYDFRFVNIFIYMNKLSMIFILSDSNKSYCKIKIMRLKHSNKKHRIVTLATEKIVKKNLVNSLHTETNDHLV